MLIDGVIRPADKSSSLSRESWRLFIDRRADLRRPPPRQGRNPCTGEIITIPASLDTAEVIQGNNPVGIAYWSMSDEPLINVSVEEAGMPLVQEWAAELDGEFSRN